MSTNAVDRNALWDEFLKKWPIDSLSRMTLPEYSTAGDTECFTHWVEARTDELGSIWGGSAFKFGIYSRLDRTAKESGRGMSRSPDGAYAWTTKFGKTAEEAFATVRENVVRIANAARQGDLQSIETAMLWPVFRWKIAFLYQDRTKPSVMPIFKVESMRSLPKSGDRRRGADLHQWLMSERGTAELFTYGDKVYEEIKTIESQKLTLKQAQEFFSDAERFDLIGKLKDEFVGIRFANGAELVLSSSSKFEPSMYLSAGSWLDDVSGQLKKIVKYPPKKRPNEDFSINAPTLAIGNDVVRVQVPTMAALQLLSDAYEGVESTEAPPPQPPTAKEQADMATPPLNQILYGPPGTGKTYETIAAALEILDPRYLADHANNREALRSRFIELEKAKRVRFTTFHQSFSYEDFVEGIRANVDADNQAEGSAAGVSYSIEKGVFAELCEDARRDRQASEEVASRDGGPVEPDDAAERSEPAQEPYVMIIDEINRGSVSRIFGELITLIEPSKRAGAVEALEALEAILPYSKKPFSVPSNVYLIGTMNTADRSLAGLDVALRRRFVFREMPPRPDLLRGVIIEGIDVEALLTVLNQRIEALLDREHCIGHAYFLPLAGDAKQRNLAHLSSIFRRQIVPLLQEYFFEDWQRIQWVLNDHRKTNAAHKFIAPEPQNWSTLFGDNVVAPHDRQAWRVNEDAFGRPESYRLLIGHSPAA